MNGEADGLSEQDAAARLAECGPNALPGDGARGLGAIVLEVVREPMLLMLLAAGALYLSMGQPRDAALLLGFVFVVIGITVAQERRTERALDALRDLSSPRALVIRSGVRRRIPGREVVPGDWLVVAEGDRIPADALLRHCAHLSVDESLLTGESVPVRKSPSTSAQALDPPGGDGHASLFSGTLVVAGQGTCEVLATGPRSQLGRIGAALGGLVPERTPLQLETGRVVRILAIAGIGACALVVLAYALRHGGGLAQWRDGLLAGLTLAMAILPEEFPVVLTVFLALGAWRISRSHVLTRRLAAIESLGAATVLCVDKTGTLTENRMTVAGLHAGGEYLEPGKGAGELPAGFATLLNAAVLASRPQPFDPMERALHAAHARWLPSNGATGQPVREYPLSDGLLAMSLAWSVEGGARVRVASKGAPEAILSLCDLAPAPREAIARQVSAMARNGLRVLGVAAAELASADLPDTQAGLRLAFVGLVGFADPVRADVPQAVAECRSAGVRTVMITGDYPETAMSIARAAGLDRPDQVLTGAQVAAMAPGELAARVRDVQVYARVVPEQKLAIVTALKSNGEVVAMTGDGVNDAPALKAAHIGIAMGSRGTDVAREAAALVLLDDAFGSIVAAIRLGRRIYDNIRKATTFILAVHVPIIGLSVLPVLLPGWPLLLLPVHVVFLELIIDPACTLVFEAEAADPGIMQRPPRGRGERLFDTRTVTIAVLQGLSVLAAALCVHGLASAGHSADAVRALTFSSLVVSLLVVILANRSWTRSLAGMLREPNAALWWVVGGGVLLLAAALAVPAIRTLFHFAPPHAVDLAWSLAAGIACLAWFEVLKASPAWRSVPGRRR